MCKKNTSLCFRDTEIVSSAFDIDWILFILFLWTTMLTTIRRLEVVKFAAIATNNERLHKVHLKFVVG